MLSTFIVLDKDERKQTMGWKQARREMRSDFLALPANGDTAQVVFCGEPFTRRETGVRGQPQTRAYFPIETDKGLQAWGVGKQLFKDIDEMAEEIWGLSVTITRQGERGDSNTTYQIVLDKSQNADLVASAKTEQPKEFTDLYKRVLQQQAEAPDKEDF